MRIIPVVGGEVNRVEKLIFTQEKVGKYGFIGLPLRMLASSLVRTF